MEEGSKPFVLIYRIYYRLLGTQINPDAKIQVPKMIQWQDVMLPNDCLLEQESPPTKPVFD